MPQLQNRNPLNIYYVNKKQSNSRVKPQNNNITINLMMIVKPKKWLLAIRWLNIYNWRY